MTAASPHLDVDQLLADETERALDDSARQHLAACPACRAEADRWATVAAGVQHLVAATPAPPELVHLAGLPPHRSQPARRRNTIVAVAAAAALVAGGTSYGLTARSGSSPLPQRTTAGPSTVAGLTAVHGCPGKYITAGTLKRVSGTRAIIQPANDTDHVNRIWRAQPVTVATTSSTAITRPANGTVSDITDGSRVFVQGSWSGTKLAATQVGIEAALPDPSSFGPRFPFHPGRVRRLGPPISKAWLGPPFADGTVVDFHDGSFTVVTDNPILGSQQRIQVVTAKTTKILTTVSVSLSQLALGANVVAVGTIGPHGVLTASTVAEQGGARVILAGGPTKIRTSGCSAAAITTAAILAGR